MLQIGVIGKSGKIPKDIEELAEKVGYYIARNNAALICGGRDGVMEAACRGVDKGGGIAIGIVPSYDGSDANKWCHIVIRSGLGYIRNPLNVISSDVVILINGSWGTFSEFTYAQIYDVTVVILKNSGGIADYIISNPPPNAKYYVAETPEEAVKMAITLAKSRKSEK